MWNEGRAAVVFWLYVSVAVFIVLVLIGKSALTYLLQQRAARRERDEHETSGHPG